MLGFAPVSGSPVSALGQVGQTVGGLVCGTAAVSPRTGGTVALAARTGGTVAISPRTGGTASVEEC